MILLWNWWFELYFNCGFAEVITDHPENNIPESIYEKIGRNLHHQPDHPIGIIKDAIYSYFHETYPGVFSTADDLYPIVASKAVSFLFLKCTCSCCDYVSFDPMAFNMTIL